MRFRTRAIVLTILLLPIVLLLAHRAWQHPSGQTLAPPQSARPATAPSTPPSAAIDPAPSPWTSEPLPPANSPISDVATLLQSRADAGDSKAACRLGIELLRCHLLLKVHQAKVATALVDMELSLEEKGKPADANRLAGLNLLYLEQADRCSALPDELVAQGPRYLRQAALAGEPEAMLRYADGQSLPAYSGYGYLRLPEFDRWRAEAPSLLQRALAAGRPEAVALLYQAHSSDLGLLQSLLADDATQAHAYFLLQQKLFNGPGTAPLSPPAGLDADQLRQANDLAATWHERHFQGRQLDFSTSLHGLSPIYDPTGISAPAFRDHAFCEPVKAPENG